MPGVAVSKDITFFEYQENDEDWSIQCRQSRVPQAMPVEPPEPEIKSSTTSAEGSTLMGPPAPRQMSVEKERIPLSRELKGLKEDFDPRMSLAEREELNRSPGHRRTVHGLNIGGNRLGPFLP